MNTQVKNRIMEKLGGLDSTSYPAITRELRTEDGRDSAAASIYEMLANNPSWTFLNAATSYELTLNNQND